MPVLSTIGSASSHGWDRITPVVTGGTKTADATYYYHTFTDATSWNELKVSGGPVKMDVLVVGHGGDGAVSTGNSAVAWWNYGYHGYSTCNYYWGQCPPFGGYGSSYYNLGFYCDCCDCYADYLYNWYANDARTYFFRSGAGGGGQVVTASITVSPGIHLIAVGKKNGLTFPNYTASLSYAFGIFAYPGGSYGYPGYNGMGSVLDSGPQSGSQTLDFSSVKLPLQNSSIPDAEFLSYKPNESSSWIASVGPLTPDQSYTSTTAPGKSGGGRGTTLDPASSGLQGANYKYSDLVGTTNLNSYYVVDIRYFGGWGGGSSSTNGDAYGVGYNSTTKPYVHTTWALTTPAVSSIASNSTYSAIYADPGYEASEGTSSLAGVYQSINVMGALGEYAGTVALFNTQRGSGVDALGLKVGGGGMGNRSGRWITDTYGGGYPGDSSTTDPFGYAPNMAQYGLDSWDITPHRDGKPNTGGGGGGGTGGSGVVRVRYLRSAVGG